MPQKRVSVLGDAINAARLVTGGDEMITGVTNDSRRVRPGFLYAALPGAHVDGHRFIADAVAAGARGILCSTVPEGLPESVAVFVSEKPRLALSELSARFYDSPSHELPVVGVTGTDGKTSTVYFLYQILRMAGERAAFLSTSGMAVGDAEQDNLLHQSTPEAPDIHATLRDMVTAGNTVAVLESTSHGLSAMTCRLAHVRYRAGVFTNLSHEHLEFHGTYDRYRHDKCNLFRALDRDPLGDDPAFGLEFDGSVPAGAGLSTEPPPVQEWGEAARRINDTGSPFGIVNLDSPEAGAFAAATSRPVFGYSTVSPGATLRATGIAPGATGTTFTLAHALAATPASLAIPGVFNVENVLAAVLAAAILTGSDPMDLASELKDLRPVKGRMNVIAGDPYAVIVDYAHTPGAFRRVLPFFRELTPGRLIVVFGSGGERDVAKRPQQGAIAGEFADIIVLADEDPRGEDRMAILDQIAAGCRGRRDGEDLFRIPDRREAIRHALRSARPGDTVLLLGKGHEATIIGPDRSEPWDEAVVAREELQRLGIR